MEYCRYPLTIESCHLEVKNKAINKNGCVFTRIMSKHREARKIGFTIKRKKGVVVYEELVLPQFL